MDSSEDAVDNVAIELENLEIIPPLKLWKLPDNLTNFVRSGICLIFNNKHFFVNNVEVRGRRRRASQKDLKPLKEVFEKLKFQVKIFEDKTQEEIMDILESEAKRYDESVECLICCISTHGNKDTLLDRNWEKYLIRDVLQKFKPEVCEALDGKPKLFFIQACQGDKRDLGVVVNAPGPSRGSALNQVEQNNALNEESSKDGSETETANDKSDVADIDLPWPDFFLARACYPGYKCYRDPEGSFFFQAIAKAFTEQCERSDFQNILVLANKEVCYHKEKELCCGEDEQRVFAKQTFAFWSTLRQRLFFMPRED